MKGLEVCNIVIQETNQNDEISISISSFSDSSKLLLNQVYSISFLFFFDNFVKKYLPTQVNISKTRPVFDLKILHDNDRNSNVRVLFIQPLYRTSCLRILNQHESKIMEYFDRHLSPFDETIVDPFNFLLTVCFLFLNFQGLYLLKWREFENSKICEHTW